MERRDARENSASGSIATDNASEFGSTGIRAKTRLPLPGLFPEPAWSPNDKRPIVALLMPGVYREVSRFYRKEQASSEVGACKPAVASSHREFWNLEPIRLLADNQAVCDATDGKSIVRIDLGQAVGHDFGKLE